MHSKFIYAWRIKIDRVVVFSVLYVLFSGVVLDPGVSCCRVMSKKAPNYERTVPINQEHHERNKLGLTRFFHDLALFWGTYQWTGIGTKYGAWKWLCKGLCNAWYLLVVMNRNTSGSFQTVKLLVGFLVSPITTSQGTVSMNYWWEGKTEMCRFSHTMTWKSRFKSILM